MYGSIIMNVWRWNHFLLLVLAARQDMRWRIGWMSKVWMEVWKRKWHQVGRLILTFFRCQFTLLLMSSRISSFMVPPVAWRVWSWKFQKSQATSHKFLMSVEIHILSEAFVLSDWRWRFLISAQLLSRSSIRASIQPILVWFLKDLATANGRGVGGYEVFPFFQEEISRRTEDIIRGAALFWSPHAGSVSWSLLRVLSYLVHWKRLSVSPFLCTHPLGQSEVGHTPLFYIIFPVVIFLEESLSSHLCQGLGAVFVVSWRELQSKSWRVSFPTMDIVFQSTIKGGEKRARSMESYRFVEICFPW